MPIDVQLQQRGVVSGRILDHEGRPLLAHLFVVWETTPFALWNFRTVTKSDGTFEVNVDHRHRFVIRTQPVFALGEEEMLASEVLSGPRSGVDLRSRKPKGTVSLSVGQARVETARSSP